MRTSASVLLRLTAAMILATCGPGKEFEVDGQQTYSFRSDPDSEFISMTYHTSGYLHQIDIYSDGRVNYSILGQRTEEKRTFETSVATSEVNDLLKIIIDSGMMQHDHKKAKLAYLRNPITINPRIYWPHFNVRFTIQLVEDNCPGRAPKSPITARVSSQPLTSNEHPGVSELQAAARLYEKLQQYRQKAEQSPRE